MASSNDNIVALLEAFGAEVAGISKQASIGDSVDDGTKPATEGERSAENTADIKKSVPNGTSSPVVNKDDGKSKGPQSAAAVGHGPTGEGVPSAKTTKDDPGTSHPAKVASLRELVSLGNEISADIVVAVRETEKQAALAAAAPAPAPVAAAPAKVAPAATAPVKAASPVLSDEQLGFLAGQFVTEQLRKGAAAQPQAPALTKLAEDEVTAVIERAVYTANKAADFLDGYFGKRAEALPPEMAGGPEMGAMPAELPPEAGAMPPEAAGGEEDLLAGLPPELIEVVKQMLAMGMTEAQILEALQSGGSPEGGAPADAGAPPIDPASPAPAGDALAGPAAAEQAQPEKMAAASIAKVAQAIVAKINANKAK